MWWEVWGSVQRHAGIWRHYAGCSRLVYLSPIIVLLREDHISIHKGFYAW